MRKDDNEYKKRCFICGEEVMWSGSEDYDEITGRDDPDYRIVDYYTCPNCGYEYEVCSPTKEEQEKIPFWNK